MSIVSKLQACTITAALALLALSPISSALAQTGGPTQRSSVLPTGGGAALLDASDTGKGHKRCRTAVEHNNARETSDAFENSGHNDCLRAKRAERTAHAGNPSVRTACSLRTAQG